MGKSSGGIRNAGKNTKKSNSINRQVETYSYEYNGEKYTFKIEKNEYKVDRVIEYVNGEKSGRDFNVKSFLENINRSENKNLQNNTKKSKVTENEIKVGTGVFGENENWRITSKKSDLIGIFPKKIYSKDKAIKSYLENINRTKNKKVQKVSSENLLKSVNFEKPQKSDYDKIKKAIELDFKKRNSFQSNKSSVWKFVKFEKNYNGTYDAIYNSPLQKNVRMTWNDIKTQAKMM